MSDAANETHKLGIARVSLDLLAQLFHLPEGHSIVAVRTSLDSPTVYFEILISGPACPESSIFEETPRVRVNVIQHEDASKLMPARTFTAEIEAEGPSGPKPDWLQKARAA